MHTIHLNTANKNRKILYLVFLISTAFILGVYFRENHLMLVIGYIMITLSIVFEVKGFNASNNISAIILDDEYPNTISLFIDDKQSDFWDIKRSIIINNWVYVYLIQQGSNKQFKLWLNKSNFKNHDEIRLLARKIHFSKFNG